MAGIRSNVLKLHPTEKNAAATPPTTITTGKWPDDSVIRNVVWPSSGRIITWISRPPPSMEF